MNLMPVLKAGSNLIVSMGAGAIVTNAVKSTTPGDLKTFQKVTVAVGAMVLSSVVSEVATKHSTEKIEAVEAHFKHENDSKPDQK